MVDFKRGDNTVWTRSRSRSSAGTRPSAPYPAPPVPEPAPASEPRSGFSRWLPSKAPVPTPPPPQPGRFPNLTSMSRDERALSAGILAVVAAVGIGIGYVLPDGGTDEAPLPVATQPRLAEDFPPEAPAPDQEQDDAAPPPAADPVAPADAVPDPVVPPGPAPAPEPAPDPALYPEPDPVPPPAPVADPASVPQPAAQLAPVYFQNCTAVRAAGAAPILQGEPGYGTHLDRDGDGIGCDT